MAQDLKVYHIQNGIEHLHPVKDIEQAKELINTLTEADLKNPNVEFNAFGLLEWDEEEQEYLEYYDEEGRDIIEILDAEEELTL
jgi:antitoxin component HigA of HigAB toxin-antitoxin module